MHIELRKIKNGYLIHLRLGPTESSSGRATLLLFISCPRSLPGAVFVSSSSTGYIVIWDLRSKREVVALAYGGAGQVGIIGGGGRRGISDFAWHPSNVSYVHCAHVLHPSHLNRLQDL